MVLWVVGVALGMVALLGIGQMWTAHPTHVPAPVETQAPAPPVPPAPAPVVPAPAPPRPAKVKRTVVPPEGKRPATMKDLLNPERSAQVNCQVYASWAMMVAHDSYSGTPLDIAKEYWARGDELVQSPPHVRRTHQKLIDAIYDTSVLTPVHWSNVVEKSCLQAGEKPPPNWDLPLFLPYEW
jgi:hypothetical protein